MEQVACWPAGLEHISCHFAIRHQVFVEEQGVMVFTDVDRYDREPDTIHVVAASGDQAAGTVRLYPLDHEGLWKGDRLAVLPAHRTGKVGAHLVHFAVATAASAGGLVMHASVQVQNTPFFEHLGWQRHGGVITYHGLPHQPMAIDLPGATADAARFPDTTELRLPLGDLQASPLLVTAG